MARDVMARKSLGLEVLDLVVVGSNGHVSLKERGLGGFTTTV